MKKPTPKMMAILEKLAEEGNYAHYMPYMGNLNPSSYYFLHNGFNRCTVEIRGLLSRGLAESFDKNFSGHKVRISEFGRKYLRDCKAKS